MAGYCNDSSKIRHLLVAHLLERLLSIGGLNSGHGYGVAVLVILATLIGVVSQMGAALGFAMLTEFCRPCFLWDSFTGVPRRGTLLETSLDSPPLP
jgi:hypothetical protein